MTDVAKPETWTCPEWLESYREMLESDLGGNSLENLLNDHSTNGFNNVIRAGLICMADSKVRLMHGLHKRGLLTPPKTLVDAGDLRPPQGFC